MIEKFQGQQFKDLFHLLSQAAAYERLLKDKEEG